jgi:Flp pilus assembly pilin Flp
MTRGSPQQAENETRQPRRRNAGAVDRPAAPRPGKETMKMVLLLPLQAILTAKSVRREDGQALVEYALLLFLIAVVSIAILSVLGQSVSSVFNQINTDF